MTELAIRPDQEAEAFRPQQERLVFVPLDDQHGRQFEINAQQRSAIGGDSSEINQAVEDAYRAAQQERNEAAAHTQEHGSSDAELAQAIDWNAQAMVATRQYEVMNG